MAVRMEMILCTVLHGAHRPQVVSHKAYPTASIPSSPSNSTMPGMPFRSIYSRALRGEGVSHDSAIVGL